MSGRGKKGTFVIQKPATKSTEQDTSKDRSVQIPQAIINLFNKTPANKHGDIKPFGKSKTLNDYTPTELMAIIARKDEESNGNGKSAREKLVKRNPRFSHPSP